MLRDWERNCSCCGSYISIEQINFLKSTGEHDSEGNTCESCYTEQQMYNWFEFKEIEDEIYKSLKPLNAFKFKFKTFEEKVNIIFNLMDKSIISWKIG